MQMLTGTRLTLFATALLWGLLGSFGQAQAAVIFNNGAPDLRAGFGSDFGIPMQVADDFVFEAVSHSVTDVHWWGGYYGTADSDEFTIRIFDDAGGVPDADDFIEVVFSGAVTRIDTLQSFGTSLDVYEYWVDIEPVMLPADETFWLSVVNNVGENQAGGWFWATSDFDSGNAVIRSEDGEEWALERPRRMAFRLTGSPVPEPTGALPEPTGALLFGIGWVVVGGVARQRRQR